MLRLGHIEFSNCLPIHASVLETPPQGLEVVHGIPSRLNADLEAGRIDVAPCSSIEFARHADRYRVLPRLVIGSEGPVYSILFETAVPPHELSDADVALPTASATSVVLLKILAAMHWQVHPRYRWFSQDREDPFADGAKAALWIGDVALLRQPRAGHHLYDLGAVWNEWTGLPFAFAVWQTRLPQSRDAELLDLLAALEHSRDRSLRDTRALARRYTGRFGLPIDRLADYWSTLRYDLDEPMIEGLLRFYRHASELSEAPRVSRIRWVGVHGAT